jgi:murein DD-endopeptidase MepM/ murein hydrolase activator NlpD
MRNPVRYALALAAAFAAPAYASTLEVRFYPTAQVRSVEVDKAHGLKSIVLHNLAIVNSGGDALELDRVTLELQSAQGTLQSQALDAAELTRAAARTKPLADAGVLNTLAFQFAPEQLLGKDIALSGTNALAGRQASLTVYRSFVYRGDAVRLHVVAEAHDANRNAIRAQADLPVVQAAASGYLFPLTGSWYVGAGSSFHTAHRWAVPEEFALDLLRVDGNGNAFRGNGTRRQDYYGYAAPVRAAHAGRVIDVFNDLPETDADLQRAGESKQAYMQRVVEGQMARLAQGTNIVIGNHVTIDHGDGSYATYAHLQTGSITLKVGEEVRRGQPLGKLGTSGNSTAPHLHFQVCDAPDALHCAGIPIAFDEIELPLADDVRALQSGDFVAAH